MHWYVKRMSKSWGHLCLKCILSLSHPIGFWQIDTWEYMCVKLCQGAEAEVLISELKLCDSSLMMTSFAEQLTVILSKHPERAIIRVESSSNPPSCEVSRYGFWFFLFLWRILDTTSDVSCAIWVPYVCLCKVLYENFAHSIHHNQ